MPRVRLGWTTCFALLVCLTGRSPARASDGLAPGPAPVTVQPVPVASAPNPLAHPTPEPTERLTSWYGYQIVLADAASIGLGLLTDNGGVLVASYILGPIILHGVHRRPGLAFLSPMLRVFLPLIGVAIGTQHKTCNANGDECLLGGIIVGGGIGVATAMILDWSLGWEKSAVPPPVEGKPAGVALTSAGVAPTGSGFNLMLGGRF